MTKETLKGFSNEYEMICAAQDGNRLAWLTLFKHYENLLMSQLYNVKGLSRQERMSEAADVFAGEVIKFDRQKVKQIESCSLFAWLWCRVINRTHKLIRQRKKEVHLYFEDVDACGKCGAGFVFGKDVIDTENAPLEDSLIGTNPEIYNTYNPEKLVVENLHEDDSVRVKNFYNRLSQFERDILEARREGLTLAQVATKFCCSVSTIKNHITRAKYHANDIFQVCYA